jgi:vacuolar-type H+-ATPase subunit H
MTAFEEVLQAETEAEQSINTAKEAAAAAVAAAKEAQQQRIAAAQEAHQRETAAAVADKERAVASLTEKIKAEADAKATQFQQRFATKKAELKVLVTQQLS